MINNSTSNLGLISIEQVITLLALNIIGIVCIGLIGYIINKKAPDPRAKLVVSAEMGLVSIILFAVISGDLGIFFWIKSGNCKAAMIAAPLFICLGPFMFPVVAIGTYIQLIYRDKMQGYVDSHKR